MWLFDTAAIGSLSVLSSFTPLSNVLTQKGKTSSDQKSSPALCTQIALLTQVYDFIDSGMHLPHPHKETIIADSEPGMGWESGH